MITSTDTKITRKIGGAWQDGEKGRREEGKKGRREEGKKGRRIERENCVK